MNETNQNDQIRQLFNNVLYVLQHSMYRGEDAHLVELSKQFITEMKKDFEAKVKMEADKAVTPVTPVVAEPVIAVTAEVK